MSITRARDKSRTGLVKKYIFYIIKKTKESILYAGGNAEKRPGYLDATIDFKYAEKMHDKYTREHN